MTYQELIDEAADILRKPDLTDVLFSFLKQAESDLANNPIGPVPDWVTSAVITLPAAATEVSLPAGFGRPVSLKETGEDVPLTATHFRSLLENGYPDAFTDEPTEYAVIGTQKIIFGGVYEVETTFTLWYATRPIRPTATSATMSTPDTFIDVVLARLLHLGYLDQRDPLEAKWEKIWDRRMAEAMKAGRRLEDNIPMTPTMVLTR
jgi:hypothetical protein